MLQRINLWTLADLLRRDSQEVWGTLTRRAASHAHGFAEMLS